MAKRQTMNKKGLLLCEHKGCRKVATYNLQGDGWVLWSIDSEGNYHRQKEWGLGEGDNNEHYCEEHAVLEGII